MRWVTRAGARLDRASMIWLIRRRIDPAAEIIFLSENEVLEYAAAHEATPFHHPGAELRNTGLRTGFDALIAHAQLQDPALTVMSLIIRGVETPARDLTPWSQGLRAVALGLRAHHTDDDAFVDAVGTVLDGLYRFSQDLVALEAAPAGR